MAEEKAARLGDVHQGVIQPLNQSELKVATAVLKEISGRDPALAALLGREASLKVFLAAAFSLSPFRPPAETGIRRHTASVLKSIGQPHELFHAKRLRASCSIDSDSLKQTFAANALQALPKHLAALPESRLRHTAKLPDVCGQGSFSRNEMDHG